jgi:hypothetical protein
MADPTQDAAITRAVPWVLAAFGGAGGVVAALRGTMGIIHAFRDLRREVADLRCDVAALRAEDAKILALVNGDPDREDDWGFAESKRQLRAMKKRVDQFHEIVAGEHGFYSKFAKYDEQIKVWATWRHDVIDKELNRLSLEIGTLEDDHEKTKAEVAQCERRKS